VELCQPAREKALHVTFKDHRTNPQIRSISLDQPAALLTVIDNLRAAFGDRLPGGTTPT